MSSKLLILILTAVLYWIIQNYVPYGSYILLPVNLFVTFLHELGHALFAIITGGGVKEVYVQGDGAGYAITMGGFQPLILMGGYIGSAIFGNILLYVGLSKPKTSIVMMYVLIASLLFTAIWWFSSVFTTLLLITFAVVTYWVSKKSKKMVSGFLIVIGTASLVYIIQDYNSGPSSDLSKFTDVIPIFPQTVWAIIWLVIVVTITWYTLRKGLKF